MGGRKVNEEEWKTAIENKESPDAIQFLIDFEKKHGFLPKKMKDALFSKLASEIDFILTHIAQLPSEIQREARRKIISLLLVKDFFYLSRHQQIVLANPDCFVACSKETRKKIIKMLLVWTQFEDLASLLERLPKNKKLLTKEIFEMLFQGYLPFEKVVGPNVFRMVYQLLLMENCPSTIRANVIDAVKKILNDKYEIGHRFRLIYQLIAHDNLLSNTEKRELIEQILSKKALNRTYLVLCLPNLQLDLKEKALSFLRKKTIRKIKSAWLRRFLDRILQKRWFLFTSNIAHGIDSIDRSLLPADRFFHRLDNNSIFVFNDDLGWSVNDIERKPFGGKRMITSVLLSGYFAGEAPLVKVILLRDPNNLQIFAYRANPEAKTVKEAIALGYGFPNPEKFSGFVKET